MDDDQKSEFYRPQSGPSMMEMSKASAKDVSEEFYRALPAETGSYVGVAGFNSSI